MPRSFKPPSTGSAFSLGLFLALVSAAAHATPWDTTPGYVPKGNDHLQASDLLYKGKVLTPDDATKLLKSGTDISKIDPEESADYWQNKVGGKLDPEGYTLHLQASNTFQYMEDVESVVGDYRFAVNMTDEAGNSHIYNVLLSRTAHNRLLRKALLEKIGYKIPALQWMPKLRVQFSGSFSKTEFIKSIQNSAEADPGRWVVKGNDADSTYVDLQDVIVYSANSATLNLSDGIMTSDFVFGRRIINSLLVPYNITDVPESINSFNWQSGKVVDNGAYIPYYYASAFSPSYQDTQWITRRIARLTRADFQEIVVATHVPKVVGEALTERLISRRNIMDKIMTISDAKDITVNPQISDGADLVAGKITKQDWPGYAARFSFGDPASPISKEEVGAFLESKVFSSGINSLVNTFNTYVNKTQTQYLQNYLGERSYANFIYQLVTAINTGSSNSVPFAVYKFPMINGSLVLSREVVFGSYMGSDNLVQVADSFGVQINPGYYIGFDGLPTNLLAKANVGFQVSRVYTHLTPVKSVLAANKLPYRNILVPFFTAKAADPLKLGSGEACNGVKDEANNPMTDQILCMAKKFKDSLQTGESVLITDTLALGASISAQYPIQTALLATGSLADSVTTLRRVQLLKKDDNTIQVYVDPGVFNTADASIGLAVGVPLVSVPVLTLSFTGTAGVVNSRFSSLDITADEKANPNLASNLKAIYSLLRRNSLEGVESSQTPFQLRHHFDSTGQNLSFLFFQATHRNVNDNIAVTTPQGQKQNYIFRTTGVRTGKDYQSLLAKSITALLQGVTSGGAAAGVAIDNTSNGDPASTLYGSSVVREVTLEAQQSADPEAPAVKEIFAEIQHKHSGWQISRASADRILAEFNQSFHAELAWPTLLGDTTEIQLYMIQLKANIYQAGIDHLASLSTDDVHKMVYNNFSPTADDPSSAQFFNHIEGVVGKFESSQAKYLAAKKAGEGQAAANAALALVDAAETIAPGYKLVDYVGGKKNLLVQVQIQGFRKGDETATEDLSSSLVSNTIGVPGSREADGPLDYFASNLGLSPGELFLAWIFNPL